MAEQTPDPTDPTGPDDRINDDRINDDRINDDRINDDRINDELVSALNDAYDTDPIPAELSQFAFDAFAWRLVDDELATITFDSATTELVGIRGTSTQRHSVQFEGRGVSVSLVMSDTSLVASVDPAGVHRCLIEGPQVATEVFTDDDGEFVIDRPHLPLRLVVETTASRLVSPWITA